MNQQLPVIEEKEHEDSDIEVNPSWRSGKWTPEEEEYAEKLVEAFQLGLITLKNGEGKTMRSFLSKRLNCNPMRISKKFAGFEGLGVRYKQSIRTRDQLDQCDKILHRYETKFLERDQELRTRKRRRKDHTDSARDVSSASRVDCWNGERNMFLDKGIFNEASVSACSTDNMENYQSDLLNMENFEYLAEVAHNESQILSAVTRNFSDSSTVSAVVSDEPQANGNQIILNSLN